MPKVLNLLRDAEPTLRGKAKVLSAGQPPCQSVFHLVSGGNFIHRVEAHVGKGLERHAVQASVCLKGDGIVALTLGVSGQKARRLTFTLTPAWLPYTITWPTPNEKDPAPLKGGKETITFSAAITGNNVCWAKDVSLEVREPKEQEAEGVDAELKGVLVPPGLANIVSSATIRITPYGSLTYRVRDGDDGTGIYVASIGDHRCGAFEFIFEQPQEIALVRFYQAAASYALFVDADGDREYERLLAHVTGHKPTWYDTDWLSHPFDPPVRARGIKLANLTRRRPLMEMEIYVPEEDAPAPVPQPKSEPGVPTAASGDTVEVAAPRADQCYMKGVVIEPWMFNWYGWRKDKQKRPLLEFPQFKKLAEDLRDWGANVAEIFPPSTFVGPNEISPHRNARLWPSKDSKYSIKENDLAKVCDGLHKYGMKVFIVQGHSYWCGWKADERDKEPDYHKRYAWLVQRRAGQYLEMIESGVDGVSLCFDEQYAGGSPDREQFMKRWGHDRIPARSDTEGYRRWKLFQYTEWARYLRDIGARMREVNREFIALSRFSVTDCCFNNRPRWGVAYDLLGRQAGLDHLGTDPYHTQEGANIGHYNCAAFTKRLVAANREQRPIVTLNAPWTAAPRWFTRFPPVSVYGPALSSAMHGGGNCIYYRFNYFRDRQDYYRHVKTAFSMLDTLAAWGGKRARPPQKIAVLKSRASEDWWYLKVACGPPGSEIERSRGFLAEKSVLEVLLANGYPFEMYYLDHPEDLNEISQFKLILIPFAYSISHAAMTQLTKAAKSGAKLLVFERAGETDELGRPYPQPLLGKSKTVELLHEDLTDHGYDPQCHRRICARLDRILGRDKPLYLNRYGHDIEATCLDKPNGDRLLLVTNWTKKAVTIDIGADMPPAKYEILRRDLTRVTQLTVNGKRILSHTDVRKLRLDLPPGEANILLIQQERGA